MLLWDSQVKKKDKFEKELKIGSRSVWLRTNIKFNLYMFQWKPKNLEVFEWLHSEIIQESSKAEIWTSRTGDPENFFVAALNIMLFLKDLLDSQKSESTLQESSVSEPTESQGASFGWDDGASSVTEISYALSVSSSVSSVFQGNNKSFRLFKKKITLKSIDPERDHDDIAWH